MNKESLDDLTLRVYDKLLVSGSLNGVHVNAITSIQNGISDYFNHKVVKIYTPKDIVDWADYAGYELKYSDASRLLEDVVENNDLALIESDGDAFIDYVSRYGGVHYEEAELRA